MPLSECEIGGDDDGRALVESADEVEQELAAGLGERTVAKFVKDDEVHPGQMLGNLRTVFRDTFRSRPTSLIVLPLMKCSRRFRASGDGLVR